MYEGEKRMPVEHIKLSRDKQVKSYDWNERE